MVVVVLEAALITAPHQDHALKFLWLNSGDLSCGFMVDSPTHTHCHAANSHNTHPHNDLLFIQCSARPMEFTLNKNMVLKPG